MLECLQLLSIYHLILSFPEWKSTPGIIIIELGGSILVFLSTKTKRHKITFPAVISIDGCFSGNPFPTSTHTPAPYSYMFHFRTSCFLHTFQCFPITTELWTPRIKYTKRGWIMGAECVTWCSTVCNMGSSSRFPSPPATRASASPDDDFSDLVI